MGFLRRLFGAITQPQKLFSWTKFRSIFGFKKQVHKETVVICYEELPAKPVVRVPENTSQINPRSLKVEKRVPKKRVKALLSKMVETDIPISVNCIGVIQKKLGDLVVLIENRNLRDRKVLFEKYDRFVIMDASIQRGHAVAAAIILRKDRTQPEVRIFCGRGAPTIVEAECIPILHFLKEPNQRTLFVTDQEPLVTAQSKGTTKKNDVMNCILSELEKSPGSKLSLIPSKHYSPYKMCHFLAGFIARMSASSLKSATDIEYRKMKLKLQHLDVYDTFFCLLRYLQTGYQIRN